MIPGRRATPRMPGRPSAYLPIVAALAAAVLLAAAAGWWFAGPKPVDVVAAAEAPLVQTLLFTGRVGAQTRVELGATTTGRVERVQVREGDVVTAGQLLAELDADEPQAQLAQAEAALDGAQSRVAALGQLSRPTAASGRAQAEATLAAARAELRRTETLVAQGFLSKSRLDELRRQVSVAQAQLDAASAQVRANAPAGAEAELARLKVSEARAARDLAASRLEATRLVAPAGGRIIQRTVEPGQVVQPGKALFVLAADGPVQLIALVDERYLGRLKIGQPARVVADAYPDAPFDASVVLIAPGIDAARGAVEIRLQVPTLPAYLKQDLTVSIEVILEQRERALTVPLAALRDAGTVWVLRDGRIDARPVRVGLRDAARIEIVEGLAAGERVVVGPAPGPGRRVRESGRAPAGDAQAGAVRAPGGGAADAMRGFAR